MDIHTRRIWIGEWNQVETGTSIHKVSSFVNVQCHYWTSFKISFVPSVTPLWTHCYWTLTDWRFIGLLRPHLCEWCKTGISNDNRFLLTTNPDNKALRLFAPLVDLGHPFKSCWHDILWSRIFLLLLFPLSIDDNACVYRYGIFEHWNIEIKTLMQFDFKFKFGLKFISNLVIRL